MIRRIASLVRALSLALALALVALWVRSHLTADRLMRTTRGLAYVECHSNAGVLEVQYSPRYPYRYRFSWVTDIPRPGHWPHPGFLLDRRIMTFLPLDNSGPEYPTARNYVARAPYWFLLMVLLALPARHAWVWRGLRRERVRRDAGRCVRCGYDLRASRERCPECGAATGATGDAVAVT